MPRQKYALVEWTGKEYENTYTYNVPLEWIIGFDEEDFIKNGCKDDEGYVIEWRNALERPENGWDCYDGIVHRISTRQKELEDRMKTLMLTLSSKFVVRNKTSSKNSHHSRHKSKRRSRSRSRSHHHSKHRKDSSPHNSSRSHKKHKHSRSDRSRTPHRSPQSRRSRTSHRSSLSHGSQTVHRSPPPNQPQTAHRSPLSHGSRTAHRSPLPHGSRTAHRSPSSHRSPTPHGSPLSHRNSVVRQSSKSRERSKSPRRSGSSDDHDKENHPIDRSNDTIDPSTARKRKETTVVSNVSNAGRGSRMSYGMNELSNRIDRVESKFNRFSMAQVSSSYFQTLYARTIDQYQIEIGVEGSNVLIDREQWDTALEQKTFTSMAVSLLLTAIPFEDLLISNYKGGKSKIKANAERKQKLPPKSINAIKQIVKYRFPDTFDRSKFGAAINTKLCKLRSQNEVDN